MRKTPPAFGTVSMLAAPRAHAQSAESPEPAPTPEPAPPRPLRPYAIGSLGVPRVVGVAVGARIFGRFAAEIGRFFA
jgi:hypothetical protein